jgi:hypothetical protein
MRTLALALLAGCGSSTPEPMPPASTPEAPATEATPPPGSAPAPAAQLDQALDPTAQAFLDAHNRVRAKHCAPPLTWSAELAQVAQAWATHLRDSNCAFEHSNNAKYGENLAGGTVNALDPEATVAMWYDEVKIYKFPSGGFSMNTGHFTQLVWTDTREVGCGHAECKGMDLIVCNYDPPGNWEGQYRDHVLPATCKK